jgi:hypothetical protein
MMQPHHPWPHLHTHQRWSPVMVWQGQEMLIYLLWAGKRSDEGGWQSFRYERHHVQAVLDAIGDSCFAVLPRSTLVQPPPPPPPPPTDTPDCAKPCGRSGSETTCAQFVAMSCHTLRSGLWPFTCDCGSCCDPNDHTPPPPPPALSPPPSPVSPISPQCLKPCGGSTCGSLAPLGCTDFESLGCDCSGCCVAELDTKCVEDEWPANLPGLYGFTDGILGCIHSAARTRTTGVLLLISSCDRTLNVGRLHS